MIHTVTGRLSLFLQRSRLPPVYAHGSFYVGENTVRLFQSLNDPNQNRPEPRTKGISKPEWAGRVWRACFRSVSDKIHFSCALFVERKRKICYLRCRRWRANNAKTIDFEIALRRPTPYCPPARYAVLPITDILSDLRYQTNSFWLLKSIFGFPIRTWTESVVHKCRRKSSHTYNYV